MKEFKKDIFNFLKVGIFLVASGIIIIFMFNLDEKVISKNKVDEEMAKKFGIKKSDILRGFEGVYDSKNGILYDVEKANGELIFKKIDEDIQTKDMTPGEEIDNEIIFDGFTNDNEISITRPKLIGTTRDYKLVTQYYTIANDTELKLLDYEGQITVKNFDKETNLLVLEIKKDLKARFQ